MKVQSISVVASLSLFASAFASSTTLQKSKSLLQFEKSGVFDKVARRRLARREKLSTPRFLTHGRELTFNGDQDACDASFLTCLDNDKCVDCFLALQSEGIDWASVTPDTPCQSVVDFLTEAGHCTSLIGDTRAVSSFCGTFDACVVWDDDDTKSDNADDDDFEVLDCSTLTECNWPGIHAGFLGDGVCHDNIYGCYNTEICGYDNGDCCEDSCTARSSFLDCGHDGYACRDPNSTACDPSLTSKCVSTDAGGSVPDPSDVECRYDETKYRLIMYDSFGDGWDSTVLKLAPASNPNKPVFSGGLADGSIATEYVCLSKSPTCYSVDVSGGTWGVEVSWEIKSMREGAPTIAGGGAPSDCEFGIAGTPCENTCGEKPDVHPDDDPDYTSLKDLSKCISQKCLIQLGACENDPVCEKCFEEDAPDYCFGVDTFDAVIDCTMCSCTERSDSDHCDGKAGPGSSQGTPSKQSDESAIPVPCSPAETIKGSNAVIAFSQCTDLDQLGMMVTQFNNNNFGELDAFELCAHSYQDEMNHGGHTALGCMQVLYNTINNPTGGRQNTDAPVEAISALATNLYHHAESFCDCSKTSSEDCPLCPSFMSFKTLLYEALDACQALDEIDCDAWNEFYTPCRNNLAGDFGSINLADDAQCNYVKRGCGGAGPFPAFRRLDCGAEIPPVAWDFYREFANNCLNGDDGIPPAPIQPNPLGPTPLAPIRPAPVQPAPIAPVPTPPAPTPVIPSDNNKPSNSDGGNPVKPYVPSDGPAKPYVPEGSKGSGKKKKSHFFRNFFLLCLIAGGGYYFYKRQSNAFNFVRYRRARTFDFGGGEREMYSGLNNSTTFEPPSLPPPPAAMGPTGPAGPMGGMGQMSQMGGMNPMGQMGPMATEMT